MTHISCLAILPNRRLAMKIQILGAGCAKCGLLERRAREAAALAGVNAEILKITDPDEIVDMGVLVTPALAVDGAVKKAGTVPSVEEIIGYLRNGAPGMHER